MDRGVSQATVQGVTKSRTGLRATHTHTHTHTRTHTHKRKEKKECQKEMNSLRAHTDVSLIFRTSGQQFTPVFNLISFVYSNVA